ncbi:MAG: hypothetical protein ACRDG4_19350, partial [Chloroflexota bacterium]
ARPGDAVHAAVRHHFYVGTIISLSAGSVTIHSKTHKANFTFTIDKGTKFLRLGQGISRKQFKVGSYVTISYSPGAHHTMIAWHISLRNHPAPHK